ncbi:MAG: hypothetical protein M1822_004431 [Bathelium mastoideum]|nr:MAG: hypothetical protein M1822_004431 [Bathelium mastoideum]
MSAYLSNLLTQTTSKYTTLRRALLADDTDGDTEDDSHVTRVLRAYYTEKGRPFPPWLPPDPKAPQPAPAQYASSSSSVGASYGRLNPAGQMATSRSGGGLSDLWDSSPQQQSAAQPSSLRRGAARAPGPAAMGAGRSAAGGGGGFVDAYGAGNEPATSARPLPSQKAGSYQSQFAQVAATRAAADSPPSSAGGGGGAGGGTAQERLKARLWGSSRSNSPTPSAATSSSQASGNPSADQGGYGGGSGGRNPYAENGGGGGGAPVGRERVGLPTGPRPRRF